MSLDDGRAAGERPWWLWALALFVAAYGLRFIFLLQLYGTPFFGALAGEAQFLQHWARVIASGQWLGLERIYPAPPLVMYYLGVLHAAFGPGMAAVRIAGCLLDAVNCLLLYLVGGRLFGRPAGLLAGTLWAVYLPALYYEAVMPGTAATVTLLLGALYFLVTAGGHGRSPVAWPAAGACLALASLGRPHLISLAPVFVLWAACAAYRAARGRPWIGRAAVTAGLLALGLAAVLALPCLRNLVVAGDPALSVNYGLGFYVGNYPDDPAAVIPRIRGSVDAGDIDEYTAFAGLLAGRPLTPREAGRFWFQRTVDHIVARPREFLDRLGGRAADYLAAYELPDDWDYRYLAQRFSVLRLPALRFGLLSALGTAGLAAVASSPDRRVRPGGRLLGAGCLIYSGAVLLMFYVSRYRLFLAPFLALSAGALAPEAARSWRGGNRLRPALLAALCCLVLAQSVARPNPTDQDRVFATCLLLEGVLQEQHGDPEAAIDRYRQSIALHGDNPRPYVYIGDLLLWRGDPRGALQWYRRGESVGPLSAHEYCNLARALSRLGRDRDALTAARGALALDPAGDEPRSLLAALEAEDPPPTVK